MAMQMEWSPSQLQRELKSDPFQLFGHDHNRNGSQVGVAPTTPNPVKPKLTFPTDPNEFAKQLGVPPAKVSRTQDGTVRMVWEPNSNTRIRYESHPEGLKPGDPGFNPRHHGEHYHIETKPDGLSWGQADRRGLIQKVIPEGYVRGEGTGFLPGEPLPGQK